MKPPFGFWMTWSRRSLDVGRVRRWFGPQCGTLPGANVGVRSRSASGRSFGRGGSSWREKRACSSRRRRGRDARRDLPDARARRGAGWEARILRRRLPSFRRRERRRVDRDLCARLFEVLGLTTEVVLGPDEGLPRTSALRCDFLTLMFKARLTQFVSTLSPDEARGAEPGPGESRSTCSRRRRWPREWRGSTSFPRRMRQPGCLSSRTRTIRFGPRRPSATTVTPGSVRSARSSLSRSASRGIARRAARSSDGPGSGVIGRSR